MLKADRMEGERERKIELGEERRWERHKGDDEHERVKRTHETKLFIHKNCFISLQISLL